MGEPQPQPERNEPTLSEPTPTDLSTRDYLAIVKRAGKASLEDHITNLAAALAYYAFLAIPAILLVAVGVFNLVADDDLIAQIIERLEGVAPEEALTLIKGHDGACDRVEREFGNRDGRRRLGAGPLDGYGRYGHADVGAQCGLRSGGDPRVPQAAHHGARDDHPAPGRLRSRVRPARAGTSRIRLGSATPSVSRGWLIGSGGQRSGRS